MINSFSDKSTEDLFKRKFARNLPSTIQRLAYRKLLLIDGAEKLDDLRMPPVTDLRSCPVIYLGNIV